jgi:glycerol-1-phosphate dehydrogenase [NAD(P)+]
MSSHPASDHLSSSLLAAAHAKGLAHVCIAAGAVEALCAWVCEQGYTRIGIVSDTTTHAIAGERIAARLSSLSRLRGRVREGESSAYGVPLTPALSQRERELAPITFPPTLRADIAHIPAIEALASRCDLLIAVGGGTISDLTKYASFRAGIPYVMCGTAPSMNGYATSGASLLQEGHKVSRAAHAPRALFLDLGILCAAPRRLIQAGVGDTACRSVVMWDQWLGSRVLGSDTTPEAFHWWEEAETALMPHLSGLLTGDPTAMASLAAMLVTTGIGMLVSGGSHPASQGEHMLAHAVEMLPDAPEHRSYHGEQIAVTTRTMLALQERAMARETPQVLSWDHLPFAELERLYGPDTAAQCRAACEQKYGAEGRNLPDINARLAALWPEAQACYAQLAPARARTLAMLEAVEAPTTPAAIGWDTAHFAAATRVARLIRERFTALDLQDTPASDPSS